MTLDWRNTGTLYRRGGGGNTEGVRDTGWTAVTGMVGTDADLQPRPQPGLQQRAFGQEVIEAYAAFFPPGSDVEADDRFVRATGPGPDVLKILSAGDEGPGWEVECQAEVNSDKVP